MFVLLGRAVIDQIAGQNRQIRPRHEFVHGCYRPREISRRVEFAHDPLRIRRGVFRSIADLQAAINAYLGEHNASPKPFVWTKSAEAILAKLEGCLYHPFDSMH